MASTVTTEQFSLRWNNFHSNLKSGFHELLQHAEMVDVTLAVDGHFLQAHKVVLSICSPYFKQMFKENPCKHPIVILKDVGHENMKDILQFMYMGEVSVLRENLSSFLRTAEVLQVKGLTGDDSNEEPCSQKQEKIDIDPEDDNEIYNQLIETTTDVDMPPRYAQTTPPPPPQTSPLPLNCPKKQSKSDSPSNPKRPKCSESYSSGYSCLKPVTKTESDTPKPNVDYKSCDFTTTQTRDVKPVVADNEEAKDYSKSGANLWKGNLLNMAACGASQTIAETGVGTSGLDQSATEQGSKSDSRTAMFKHGYQCEQCLKRFSRRDHLRTHEKNIHGSDAGPFKCMICEQLYKNTESLRKHISKFHFTNLNDLVKPLNEAYYAVRRGFFHILRHKRFPAKKGEPDHSPPDSAFYPTDAKGHVFCPYCCRKFVNRYNLKVHIRDKHESKSTDLDCQVCGKTMRNQSCLRVHLYHHRKQQMEATGIVS